VSGDLGVRHSRGNVKGSCERSRRKIDFRPKGVGKILLQLLIDLPSLIIGWVVAATEYAFDVLGAVLTGAEMSKVGARAFDASVLKMAVVPGMAVTLTIRTFCYFAFWFGGSNVILH
jgi:hypothetical protein